MNAEVMPQATLIDVFKMYKYSKCTGGLRSWAELFAKDLITKGGLLGFHPEAIESGM